MHATHLAAHLNSKICLTVIEFLNISTHGHCYLLQQINIRVGDILDITLLGIIELISTQQIPI